VVFRPEEQAEVTERAHSLRHEDVISIHGRVAPRLTADKPIRISDGRNRGCGR
jgi:aspartyl-tRNA synthetase